MGFIQGQSQADLISCTDIAILKILMGKIKNKPLALPGGENIIL